MAETQKPFDQIMAGLLHKELYIAVTEPLGGPGLAEHLETHIHGQIEMERKHILFGAGPLQDEGKDKPTRGMFIIRAKSFEDARRILKAKMAGRWEDGVSIAVAPTIAEWQAFNAKYAGKDIDRPYIDFGYAEDPEGLKCPLTSHMRRTNPRDSMDGRSSALINRRRILRRGIPYGDSTKREDGGEHGIIFLAMCASLTRQFEFVQQQWINYGMDANAGNDTCPLVGNRTGDKKFVLPVNPDSGQAPFLWADIPKFVETRGGEYFFLPSMTALRMIGMGTVDPT